MKPVEFIIPGPPVSSQGTRKKSRKNREQYKQTVKDFAMAHWPKGQEPLKRDVYLHITYFYNSQELGQRDIDNFVKPIMDALIGIIYPDDSVVIDLQSRKRNWNAEIRFHNASSQVIAGISRAVMDEIDEFVHIKIGVIDDPNDLKDVEELK